LIELAMARSLLAAHDIPYFVHNGGYASLYPGMQIGLLNVPTIMVPPSAAEFASELLRAYLPEVEDHLQPRPSAPPGTSCEWSWKRWRASGLCAV
jgi:hypothetical protein